MTGMIWKETWMRMMTMILPTVQAPVPPVIPRSRAGRQESVFTEMWEALELYLKL